MLHFRTLWLMIGWFMVSVVWIISLIPVPEPLMVNINHIDKVEHFLAYFILMSWFAQLYPEKSTRNRYAIGLILMGIAIEIAQGMGKIRMFDPLDMLANTTGVLLAWLMIKNKLAKLLFQLERWMRMSA